MEKLNVFMIMPFQEQFLGLYDMIKNKLAVSGVTTWQVNGSSAKGKKMVSDTQKLLLRAFNTECDELISKVKYTNFDASLNKIYKSRKTQRHNGKNMYILP